MTTDLLTAARAEALFTSDLSADSHPTCADVSAVIRHAIRTRGGTRGCAAVLAGEYGDHPEIAAPRMQWALNVVQTHYTQRKRSLCRHISLGQDGADLRP